MAHNLHSNVEREYEYIASKYANKYRHAQGPQVKCVSFSKVVPLPSPPLIVRGFNPQMELKFLKFYFAVGEF